VEPRSRECTAVWERRAGAQMRSADEIILSGEIVVGSLMRRYGRDGFVRLPIAVLACLVVKGPSEYPLV